MRKVYETGEASIAPHVDLLTQVVISDIYIERIEASGGILIVIACARRSSNELISSMRFLIEVINTVGNVDGMISMGVSELAIFSLGQQQQHGSQTAVELSLMVLHAMAKSDLIGRKIAEEVCFHI